MNNPKNRKIQTIWYDSQSYKNYIAQLEAEQRKIDEDRKNKPENFIKRIYNKDSGLITPEVFIKEEWIERWEKAAYWELLGNYGNPTPNPPIPPWDYDFGSIRYDSAYSFFADTPYQWGNTNNLSLGATNPSSLNYSIILNKKWNFIVSTSGSVPTVVGTSHGGDMFFNLQQSSLNYYIRKGTSPSYKGLHLKGKLTYTFGGSASIFHPSYIEPAGGYNNNIVISIQVTGNRWLVYYDRDTNDTSYFYKPSNWGDIPGVKYFIIKDLTNLDLDIYGDYCTKFGTPPPETDIFWTGIKIVVTSQTSMWGSWLGTNSASSNLTAELDDIWITYKKL